MKHLLFAVVLSVLFAASAAAELQFPRYENLSPEEQAVWGYELKRSGTSDGNTFFELTIPPKAAKFCTGARLYIRDKQHQTLVSIELGLYQGADGKLHTRIELFRDFGSAELVVFTRAQLGTLSSLDGLGGFTFTIPP